MRVMTRLAVVMQLRRPPMALLARALRPPPTTPPSAAPHTHTHAAIAGKQQETGERVPRTLGGTVEGNEPGVVRVEPNGADAS